MGGRGTAGKTKLFTNIDADRNKPFREARVREIFAEQENRRQNPRPDLSKYTESRLSEMSARQRGYIRVEIAMETKDISHLHRARSDVSEFVNSRQKVGNMFKSPDRETRTARLDAVRDLNKEINRAYRRLGHPEFAND